MLVLLFLLCLVQFNLNYSTHITSNWAAPAIIPQPHSMQSRKISIVSPGDGTSLTKNIISFFEQPFQNIPNIILSIHTFKTQLDVLEIKFKISPLSQETRVYLQYQSQIDSFFDILDVGIMIYDPVIMSNIVSQIHQINFLNSTSDYISPLHPYNHTLDYSVGFFVGFSIEFFYAQTMNPFNVQLTCSATILPLDFEINIWTQQIWNDTGDQQNLPSQSWIQYVIYEKNHQNYSIVYGVINQTDRQSPLGYSQTDYYFIGLKALSFRVITYWLLQLENNSTLIGSLPVEAAITYEYFLIKYIYTPPVYIDPVVNYNFSIKLIQSYSYFNNSFRIKYQNVSEIIQNIVIQNFILNSSKITIYEVQRVSTDIYLYCQFDEDVSNLSLKINLEWIKEDIKFIAVTEFNLLSINPPLKIYSSLKQRQKVSQFATIIEYFYLIVFGITLFNKKLIGIQLMSFIQITLYGFIPLYMNFPTMIGLTQMKYVSGYNYNFFSVDNLLIPSRMEILGIHSSFLQNFNLMLIPIIISLILSGILRIFHKKNNSYKHKPRLRKYSLAFLNQWVFVLYLFNSYNIYVSIITNIYYSGSNNILNLTAGILTIGLEAGIGFYYILTNAKYFQQFISDFNQSRIILCLSFKNSRTVCKMYPIVVMIELILFPIFLSVPSLINQCLYIILGFSILFLVYVFIVTPYSQTLNNLRLFIQRILVCLMIGLLIAGQKTITKQTQYDNNFAMYLPWVILSFLVASLCLNFPFVLWKLILWIRKRGIIDMKLFIEQKAPKNRQEALLLMEGLNPMWIPRGSFESRKERRQIKNQDQRPKNLEPSPAGVIKENEIDPLDQQDFHRVKFLEDARKREQQNYFI